MHNKVSILKDARNIVMKDSSFVVNTDTSKQNPLDRLINEVAPNAILNAGGRADEVRCYPGTREEVIGNMERWMDGDGVRTSRMMWLSGPAGAGKSAICQTVAERCSRRGLHAANFFFFRGDGTRNNARPLAATLVYQLRSFYPALNEPLADCLTATPLICKGSIEDQFRHLISSPIQTVQQSASIQRPIIFIIDGLDECDDKRKQEQILVALHALANADHSPFLVLVASRAEAHLVMSFNKIGSSAESIFLDDKYRPQDDIRRFVVAKFDEIKEHHHLAHTLTDNWPAESDINAITEKSSGQFIYAATVMRFIEYSSESPHLNVLAVRSMQPSASHNPFAQLDAVYSYIFSKTRDIRTVKMILGVHFMSQVSKTNISFESTLHLAGYSRIEIQSLFSDLVAIIKVDHYWFMSFYHASLNDYLRDKSRSKIYHVNSGDIAAELSSVCLGNFYDSTSLNITCSLLYHAKDSTSTLSEPLLTASTRRFAERFGVVTHWNVLVCAIDRLYFATDKAMFKLMLQNWIRFAYIHNIDISKDIKWMSKSATRYYKWYRFIERVKLRLEPRTK
ncbi:hypothetical protein D9619_011986 [Psilocybe cf. subviscida]|uniref:NACHT domain-containing protein n=1 Tax=Psilocybe cf. subviscida TaxID=2480587 RepID=A0A8H5B1G5_9AGAR|nr:hypothetical protein D9619_011986 [Psilocybe cf. subviscida]